MAEWDTRIARQQGLPSERSSGIRIPTDGPVILLPPPSQRGQTLEITKTPEITNKDLKELSLPPKEPLSINPTPEEKESRIDFDKSLEAGILARERLKSKEELCRINSMYPALSPSGRFIVFADTERDATTIALRVDKVERDISLKWTGEEPTLSRAPRVLIADINAGTASGLTSFNKYGIQNQTFSTLAGSIDQVINDVLPHEVAHIVFTEKLGRVPPRWADEGMATLGETERVISNMEDLLIKNLKSKKNEYGESKNRAMKINRLLTAEEYPEDQIIFYVQGTSVTKFLVESGNDNHNNGGERRFFKFIRDAMIMEGSKDKEKAWAKIIKEEYGFESLQKVQDAWLSWVKENHITKTKS